MEYRVKPVALTTIKVLRFEMFKSRRRLGVRQFAQGSGPWTSRAADARKQRRSQPGSAASTGKRERLSSRRGLCRGEPLGTAIDWLNHCYALAIARSPGEVADSDHLTPAQMPFLTRRRADAARRHPGRRRRLCRGRRGGRAVAAARSDEPGPVGAVACHHRGRSRPCRGGSGHHRDVARQADLHPPPHRRRRSPRRKDLPSTTCPTRSRATPIFLTMRRRPTITARPRTASRGSS